MRLGRQHFAELVGRQLDLFSVHEAAFIEEARTAEIAWQRTGREGAEEAYGDWLLVADAIGEQLLEVRETYAATLADDMADRYRGAFDRAAARRFPRFVGILES